MFFKNLSLINKFPFLRGHSGQQQKPQQVPAIQYGQAPIPLQQQFVKPNESSRAVDPITGLSPAQYDLDNRGLPPDQAKIYYQRQLPQGRQNLAIEPPPMAAMGQNNQRANASQEEPNHVMQPQLLAEDQMANAPQEAEGKMILRDDGQGLRRQGPGLQ